MQVIDIELSKLKEYENNPRNNDNAIEAVQNSIASFGFKVPIIIDNNFYIVAGHTRRKAAINLGLKTVPCIIADDLTEEQIKAFRLVDNKTAELADWDFIKLEEELASISIDMSAFSFDMSELSKEFDSNKEVIEDDFNAAEAAEEIINPITKQGDVWQLGEHRLLCGDSTNTKDLKLLMAGKQADLLLTDPPYNINVSNSQGMTIKNDNMSNIQFYEFLKAAFNNANENLKEGGAFYIWHADNESLNFRQASEYVGWKIRQCLIWVKNGFTLGRQDYQWKHEPCLYGWKDGEAHYFVNDRTQSTVIEDKLDVNKLKKEEMKDLIKELLKEKEEAATTVIYEDKPLINTVHPTMKPIKLIAKLISNSSRKNEIVLDIFGGSGSTLIACEQLNRKCYTIELDPKYCDVIIKRWEELTGNTAVKI